MKKYTIAEISRQTDIPESTLRYRTKLFKKYIPTIGKGRRRKFDTPSVEIFRFIDTCFADGMQTDNIVLELEKKYGPEVIIEPTKTKKSITKSNKKKLDIEIEIMTPILKVIENQEIIIHELRVQNKMLKAPKKTGVFRKLFT